MFKIIQDYHYTHTHTHIHKSNSKLYSNKVMECNGEN